MLTQQIEKFEFSTVDHLVFSALYEDIFVLSGVPSDTNSSMNNCAQIYTLHTMTNKFVLEQG